MSGGLDVPELSPGSSDLGGLGISLIERCRASAGSGALGPCNKGIEIAMLP